MGYHYPITGSLSALTVIKQANPDPVQAGEQLTYTIYVTNTGELGLHATITDVLPAHSMPTGVLTWTPTITAPGGVWTQPVVVSAETNYEGPLINVLWVTTEEGATGIHIETSDVVVAPANQAPFTPCMPYPVSGATGVRVTQGLSWHGGDPDDDPVTYTVAFGTSDPPPLAATTALARYTPMMSRATTYYWAITATDSISTSVGPTWSFTTTAHYDVFLPLVLREF